MRTHRAVSYTHLALTTLNHPKDDFGALAAEKLLRMVDGESQESAVLPWRLVERESLGLKTGWINSNEFVHSTPKDFGKNSVLCVACHAGNTPETVAAAKLGRESGAAVVLLTYQEESEIAAFADYLVLYLSLIHI